MLVFRILDCNTVRVLKVNKETGEYTQSKKYTLDDFFHYCSNNFYKFADMMIFEGWGLKMDLPEGFHAVRIRKRFNRTFGDYGVN